MHALGSTEKLQKVVNRLPLVLLHETYFPADLIVAVGATELYFYQGVMPQVPEDINNKHWGYWSMNSDFLAMAPTFEQLESAENFAEPYFR